MASRLTSPRARRALLLPLCLCLAALGLAAQSLNPLSPSREYIRLDGRVVAIERLGDNAEVGAVPVTTSPTQPGSGQPFTATVTLKNTGVRTWTTADGYVLGADSPADNNTWGLQQVALPRDVQPGEQVAITFQAVAPAAGSHTFAWRMRRGPGGWFGAVASKMVTVVSVGLTLSPTSRAVGTSAGTYEVQVTAGANVVWSVASTAAWLQVTEPANPAGGTGSRTIRYHVDGSPAGNVERTAELQVTVAGATAPVVHRVTQASNATVNLSPQGPLVLAATGQEQQVTVTATVGVTWTLQGLPAWLQASPTCPAASPCGTQVVTLRAEPNFSGQARAVTLTFASSANSPTLDVQQAAATVTLSTSDTFPLSQEAHTGKQVLVHNAGTQWTVVPDAAYNWLTVTNVNTAAAPGVVTYSVAPYPSCGSTAIRSATLRIAGQAFTITQRPAPVCLTITPLNAYAILVGTGRGFTAQINGQDATPGQVTWSVKEGASYGTIAASGQYTAPNTIPGAELTATIVARHTDAQGRVTTAEAKAHVYKVTTVSVHFSSNARIGSGPRDLFALQVHDSVTDFQSGTRKAHLLIQTLDLNTATPNACFLHWIAGDRKVMLQNDTDTGRVLFTPTDNIVFWPYGSTVNHNTAANTRCKLWGGPPHQWSPDRDRPDLRPGGTASLSPSEEGSNGTHTLYADLEFLLPFAGAPASAGKKGIHFRIETGLNSYTTWTKLGQWVVPTEAYENAALESITVPPTITAGQAFTATLRLRNTGQTTWTTTGGYQLRSANPDDNARWGVSMVALPTAVAPHGIVDFVVNATAPSLPGSYNFDWVLKRNNEYRIGPVLPRQVVVQGQNNATVTSVNQPTTVLPGQPFTATVVMRNTGQTTWTAATEYRLGARQDTAVWGLGRVFLPAGVSIAPGQEVTFTVNVTAPATPGTYGFGWQMLREGVEWFGATVERTIKVVRQPDLVTVAPASGTGSSVPLTVTLRDADGHENLDHAYVAVHPYLDGTGSCMLLYLHQGRRLHLLDNAGASWGAGIAVGATPGAGTLTNSQCTVSAASVSAPANGATATLSLTLTFPTTYAGDKTVSATIGDRDQYTRDWHTVGAWTVPGNQAPQAVQLSPASGGGANATFTATVSDPNGAANLLDLYLLVGATSGQPGGCQVAYRRPNGAFYLINSSGTEWSQPLVPGSAATLSNERCTLSGTGLTATIAGNELTATVPLQFQGSLAGSRTVTVCAGDLGRLGDCRPLGTWTVPGADAAEAVSVGVPAVVTANRPFTATVTLRNTGATTWSAAAGYRLQATSPAGTTRWGTTHATLPVGAQIAPGQQAVFTVSATAPATAGSHAFDWQMAVNGFAFGAVASQPVQVTPNGAELVAISVPAQVPAGRPFTAIVVMRNTGTTTWTAATNYRLGARQDTAVWGLGRVFLPAGASIAPGQEVTFTVNATAPATPGTYGFGWQMLREQVEWFGAEATRNVIVAVANNAAALSLTAPDAVVAGRAFTATVVIRNTGAATWTAVEQYKLGATNPEDTRWGLGRVLLATGAAIAPGQEATFTFTATAPTTPGTYNFHWRMLQEQVEWFGTVAGKPLAVVLPPSATGVGPHGVATTATTGTLDAYAYGVRDAGDVRFYVWSALHGQDDKVEYAGTHLGNGTWRATIDLSRHRTGAPDYGALYLHVWGLGPAEGTYFGGVTIRRHRPGVAATNAGFETGSVAPWTLLSNIAAAATTAQRRTGSYALADTSSGVAGARAVYQVVAGLLPGVRYRITARVRGSAGNQRFAQTWANDGVNGDTGRASTVVVPDGTWRDLAFDFDATDTGLAVVHLQGWVEAGKTGTLYWDDIEIAPTQVLNGGFETGTLAPFGVHSGATSAVTTAEKLSGSRSLAITAGEGGVYQEVQQLQPGRTYRIAGWVKGSAGATAKAQIWLHDGLGANLVGTANTTVTGEWRRLVVSFTATATGRANLHLQRQTGSGTLYWDDVVFDDPLP